MLIRLLATVATVAALSSVLVPRLVQAGESTTNKVKDTMGDATTKGKKMARTEKRKMRQATGTDNLGKDAKDKANDVGDSVSNAAEKAKRQ
jgi:hypothetical protein